MIAIVMGTEKHSKASRKRWVHIPKAQRKARMSGVAKTGWDRLDAKARRRRAMKGVRTRQAKLINVKEQS
jgi:hypothetical protein